MANPLSQNLYTYVHNNPLIYVDPSGNYCVSANQKQHHIGGCNGGEKGKEYFYDVKDSMYFPDSYLYNYPSLSFDQLYVKYQMTLLSKQLKSDMEQRQQELNRQMVKFMDDITGVSSFRALVSPETSPIDALIALSSISLPGVKGKPGSPLKTQKSGKTLKLTNVQAGDLAKYLGFTQVKGAMTFNKQPVYKYKKIYISPDADSHIGGVWKVGKSIEDLNSKDNRYGTYDALLNWMGE